MAEYYSAELSQKIRRGNNESRHKGNLTGGHVLYGYKNVNKKAVIVEEEADAIRYIFSQYASNVYVKDIIKTLTARGILFGGKPFKCTTVHKIFRNERYTGIYKFKGETFEIYIHRFFRKKFLILYAKRWMKTNTEGTATEFNIYSKTK